MALNPVDLYKDLFYRLLPKGEIWPVRGDDTPGWDALLDAMSYEFARLHMDGGAFLNALIPSTSMGDELLDFWEGLLGLTSTGNNQTRKNQIVARLLSHTLDPTFANITTIAQTYDANVTVQERPYTGAKCGLAECGQDTARCGGNYSWAYTIIFTTTSLPDSKFEELMVKSCPRHCVLIFNYV